MFGIDAAIYVYCTYVFVENKNLKPESWSSADRRCSNYIWVINNLIAN